MTILTQVKIFNKRPAMLYHVPERSIMHLTVSARLLISSGRGGGENRRGTMGGGGLYGPRVVM